MVDGEEKKKEGGRERGRERKGVRRKGRGRGRERGRERERERETERDREEGRVRESFTFFMIQGLKGLPGTRGLPGTPGSKVSLVTNFKAFSLLLVYLLPNNKSFIAFTTIGSSRCFWYAWRTWYPRSAGISRQGRSPGRPRHSR